MTRCLSDEQIERLAGAAPVVGGHIAKCESCRRRVEQARENARLLAEIAELDRSRAGIERLLERDTCGAPSTAPSA
ncbi:MAG: hypothetical protein ACKVS9_05820 [Phycisphaerae bacterium]